MGHTSSRREDRPRRTGEDVIAWAEETGRVTAGTSPQWRALLKDGQTTERFIESLASIYPPAAAGTGVPSSARPSASLRAASAESPAAELLRSMTGGDSTFREILASGVALPTLFPSGDLPEQTASGLDPGKLAAAPWWTRPAIAEASSLAEAEELLAAAVDDPSILEASDRAFSRAAGYRDFETSIRAAAMDAGRVKVERDADAQVQAARRARNAAAAAPVSEPSEAELYEAVFGEGDRRREKAAASHRDGVHLRNYWDGRTR